MDKQEKTPFARANERVHPVEKQWHFKPLTEAGFVPRTREAVGFVRRYDYEHPDGRAVSCHTGASSDYWVAGDKRGYWVSSSPGVRKGSLGAPSAGMIYNGLRSP